ncbi:MAG: hypothetical protein AMXMBFR61_19730 [Fimbriimonadales bacterium]
MGVLTRCAAGLLFFLGAAGAGEAQVPPQRQEGGSAIANPGAARGPLDPNSLGPISFVRPGGPDLLCQDFVPPRLSGKFELDIAYGCESNHGLYYVLIDDRAGLSYPVDLYDRSKVCNISDNQKLVLSGDYFEFGGSGTAIKCVDFALRPGLLDGHWTAAVILYQNLNPDPPPPTLCPPAEADIKLVTYRKFVLDRKAPNLEFDVNRPLSTPSDPPPRFRIKAKDDLSDPVFPGSGVSKITLWVTIGDPNGPELWRREVVFPCPFPSEYNQEFNDAGLHWPPEHWPASPGRYYVHILACDGAGFVEQSTYTCYSGPNCTQGPPVPHDVQEPPEVECKPSPYCSCNPLDVNFCFSDRDAYDDDPDPAKRFLSFVVWIDSDGNKKRDPGETIVAQGTFDHFLLTKGTRICTDDPALRTRFNPQPPYAFNFPGPTTVCIEVTDADGLTGLSGCVYDPDVTPPDVRNGYPQGDCICSPIDSLRFDLKDNCPEAAWVLTLDGVERCRGTEQLVPDVWKSITCPGPLDLAGGTHLVEVVVTDKCGNARSYSWTFDVDKTPPQFSDPVPTGDCVCSPVGLLSVKTSDDCAGTGRYEFWLDGVKRCEGSVVFAGDGVWTTIECPGPFDLSDGPHTVVVKVWDGCNNPGETSWTFDVDKTPPQFSDPVPTGDCVCSPVGLLSVKTSDDCAGTGRYEFWLDGVKRCEGSVVFAGDGVWTTIECPGPSDLSDGPHTVVVKVWDGCNNPGETTWTFNVDKRPPRCEWTEPSGSCLQNPVMAQFCVHDECSRITVLEITLDGEPLDWPGLPADFGDGECAPEIELPFLANGVHRLRVQTRDECGNVGVCETTFIVGPCHGPCEGCWGDELKNVIRSNFKSVDPWDNTLKDTFRPGYINLDGFTIRDILLHNNVTIDDNLIVQQATYWKCTPFWKCAAFVIGPGSGVNTFDPDWMHPERRNRGPATNADLDESVLRLALRLPKSDDGWYMGNRSLLFSPPCTTYELGVVYVVRDPNTGRIGEPQTVVWRWVLESPFNKGRAMGTEIILRNIEYFSTVALGRTQKPKIPPIVADSLRDALNIPDPTEALTAFETIVGLASVDFYTFIGQDGKRDVRFWHQYLIESDEEPVGCLLIEQAADLFFRQE